MILTWFIFWLYWNGQEILDRSPWLEMYYSGTTLLLAHNYKDLGRKISTIQSGDIIEYKGNKYKITKRFVTHKDKMKFGELLRWWIVLQTCTRIKNNLLIIFWNDIWLKR